MRFFNWAQIFKETPTLEDILKKVRKTEITYWIFLVICVCIFAKGMNTLFEAPEDSTKQQIEGAFWALFGLINVVMIKLWAHIRLTTYFLIWDRNNKIESEINKLEAQDL